MCMKQVWILNHYAQEPGGPGGTRHFSLAENLRKFGWNATIFASSVEHNTGRQRLAPGVASRTEIYAGVTFHWLRTPKHTGNGFGRLWNMLTYTAHVLLDKNLDKLDHPDLVIGSSVHLFAAWAGARLAKRYNVPFIFEVRDLWPQTLIDLGRISSHGFQAWWMRQLETWLYRHAVRTITLLPRACDYIEPLGVPRDRIFWLPNGADLSRFPVTKPRIEIDMFVFMYFGAHGIANGLDDILRAQAILEKDVSAPPIWLRLIGDGPLKNVLRQLASDLGIKRVSFEEAVSKEKISAIAAEADAFVVTLLNLPLYRFGISLNKIFDYLAAGRPIVFGGSSVNNPIDEASAGLSVPPGNPRLLAVAMKSVASLPFEERARLGSNARSYVGSNHNYHSLAARLAGLLNEVVEERLEEIPEVDRANN